MSESSEDEFDENFGENEENSGDFDGNFGELDDEIVPGLGAVLSDLLEDGNTQDQDAFMDPADIETVFDLEIEPVPMSSDPKDDSYKVLSLQKNSHL